MFPSAWELSFYRKRKPWHTGRHDVTRLFDTFSVSTSPSFVYRANARSRQQQLRGPEALRFRWYTLSTGARISAFPCYFFVYLGASSVIEMRDNSTWLSVWKFYSLRCAVRYVEHCGAYVLVPFSLSYLINNFEGFTSLFPGSFKVTSTCFVQRWRCAVREHGQ